MGMGGGRKGLKSEINVTPLVDVVLVLLIIFMVIIPMTQLGYSVSTPKKVVSHDPTRDSEQLIVRLDANGGIFINKEQIPEAQFEGRFRDSIKNRENKIVFFAADGELPYDRVASVMDICRGAGARSIGVVFGDLTAGAGAAAVLGMTR